MMKSEQNQNILYESFIERSEIEDQIKKQNRYITIILGCLIIGAVLLFCIIIL